MVFGYRDQVAIEEPMDGGRQSDTVLDDIRAAAGHRLDVGRLHFGTAAAIDDSQAVTAQRSS
jgi:hypothetical protein